MAVTVAEDTIEMTAAGDEILFNLTVQSVRVVWGGASVAGDVVELTDPVTTRTLWTSFSAGPNTPEAQLTAAGDKNNRAWRNGVRVDTNTGNNAVVYIQHT